MRLPNSEEKERSKEVQARGKAAREAKKETKREASAAPARRSTWRPGAGAQGGVKGAIWATWTPHKTGWCAHKSAVAGELY